MQNKRLLTIVIPLLLAGTAAASDFVEVSFRIAEAGEEVLRPTMVVETGRQGDFQSTSADRARRLLVTVDDDGAEAYSVRAAYLHGVEDGWSTVSQPTLKVRPSTAASMAVTAGDGTALELCLVVTPRDDMASFQDFKSFAAPTAADACERP